MRALVSLAASALLVGAALAAPVPMASEEYAVLSALVSEEFVDEHIQRVVICHDLPATASEEWASSLGYVQRELGAALDSAAIADFQSRNSVATVLARQFTLPREYVLFDEAATRQCQDAQGQWDFERYQALFPGATGLLTLSRVGFNSARTQALVHVSCFWGPTAANANFYVLANEGDTWRVVRRIELWIS